MEIINPHDKTFKEIEGIKENAVDLIRASFPSDILKNIDLESLELDNTVYIDEELKEYFSDLVYQSSYKKDKDIKIALLFEHKSYLPEYPALQLLKYILCILDANVKQKNKLPLVISCVFYHGKDKWEKRNITDYYQDIDKNLLSYIPDFKYLLFDLSKYTDKDIKEKLFQRESNKILCLLFKHVFDETYLYNELENFLMIGRNYYETEEGNRFLISILNYLFNTTELDSKELTNILDKLIKNGGTLTMTTAMKLREEGIKEGIKEGILVKAREDAKNMLTEGLDLNLISRITGLTIQEIVEIKNK